MRKLFDSAALRSLLTGGEAGKPSVFLIGRLVIAAVLFAVSLLVSAPAWAHIVLYAFAAIIAGYDLVIQAINSVEEKNFFAPSLLLCAVALVSFIIGFASEGAALLIVYQLGLLVIALVDSRSRKSALEMLEGVDEETISRLQEQIGEQGSGNFALAESLKSSAEKVLRYTMIFAAVCVVLLPLLGDISYRVSIHRALMVLIVCTPLSVAVSLPLTGAMGLAYSARHSVLFNSSDAMQKTGEANTVAFDMAGVFSQDEPRLLALQSELLDKKTFMNFVAHAAYYSEQPFAHAIASAYGQDYKLEVISDFAEIPGGVELKIAGNPVLLAVASVFNERGINIPQDQPENGQAYYMQVAGRYVGRVVVSTAVSADGRDLVDGVQELGIQRCLLFTELSSEESQQAGEELGFQEVYSECDTPKKLSILSDLCQDGNNRVVYIYANGFEAHSAAPVDIRVSKRTRFADVHVQREDMLKLPFAIQICRRMCELARENAVFVMAVKALLIFLAMTGYCSLWFAMFVDMAAALAAQLNTARISSPSVLKNVKIRR